MNCIICQWAITSTYYKYASSIYCNKSLKEIVHGLSVPALWLLLKPFLSSAYRKQYEVKFDFSKNLHILNKF
jgi:hypothetical protein